MSELSPEASALLRDARRAVEPDARSLREAQTALHEKLRLGAPSVLCARDAERGSGPDAGELSSAVPRELPRVASGWASTLALKGGLAALVTLTAAALFFGRHQHASRAETVAVVSPQPSAATVAGSSADDEQLPSQTLQQAATEHKAKAGAAPRVSGMRGGARKRPPSALTIVSKPESAREPHEPAESSAAPTPNQRPTRVIEDAPRPGERRDLNAGATRIWSGQRGGSHSGPEVAARAPHDPPPPPPFEVDSLEREIVYLRKARAALQKNDGKLAVELLREYRARYPSGALQEERLATEVLAYCLARQHDEARASLRRLARIAPESPYLAQLARSCVAD